MRDRVLVLFVLCCLFPVLARAQAAGLRASVVGHARGRDFTSVGPAGDLFRLPLDHLREMHESWMPTWIEGHA